MGWIWCVPCEKFHCDFVAQTWVSSGADRVRSLCSNEMLRNTPKYEFGVQWGGLIAFIVKNSDATSLHELVHKLLQFGHFASKFVR
jgi:hypothetical protein